MIVELPIIDNSTEDSRGVLLINVDSIQSVKKEKNLCQLSCKNGEKYTIAMEYDEYRSLWFRLVIMKDRYDFCTFNKNVISEKDCSPFRFIETVCPGCSGINFLPDEDKKMVVCQDCGQTMPAPDKI